MKRVLVLLASAAFVCAAPAPEAAAAQPQADTVDPGVPTQLPRTAVPHHYTLTVTPHADRLTFDGTVQIDLEVVKPTRQLVLNAADLDFSGARLSSGSSRSGQVAKVAMDAAAQTATLSFPRSIAAGRYRLTIAYTGKINTQANGLFALDYKDVDGKAARSLFTQFEAADARRFVPSWDEPDYKAKWDLTVVVPAKLMPVGNMPVASSRPLPGGLKQVRFQTTPTSRPAAGLVIRSKSPSAKNSR